MAATYSSGSTVTYRIIAESVYGTTPGTAMKALRLKPSKFTLKKDTYTTDEVRSDRGISDLRHGMKKVEGTLEGDLMDGDWEDIILAGIQSTAWSNGAARLGLNLTSFSIEQQFNDISQFRMYSGCSVSKLKISIKPGAMVSISADFIGKDAAVFTSTAAANTTTAASTNSPFSYSGGSILEGGTAIAYVTGVDFEVDNGLGQVGVIGANTSPAVFNGRSSIKGTVTALFKDAVMMNKFVNETESSLQITLTDPAGISNTIILPRIKYTASDAAPPKDGATIITLPFEALLGPLVSTASSTSMAVSAATGPGSATLTKVAGTSFITEGFKVGQLITVKNLTTSANNGDWVLTAVAAQVLTFQVPTGYTTTVQAAGAFGNGAGDIAVNPTNIVWVNA